MPQIVFVLTTGEKHETSFERPPFPDLAAFEREFDTSSAVIERSAQEARKLKDAGETVDYKAFFRSEWFAFFGWRSLRRRLGDQLPARFAAFVELVDEMRIEAEPGEEDDSAGITEEPGLDPTRPEGQPSG